MPRPWRRTAARRPSPLSSAPRTAPSVPSTCSTRPWRRCSRASSQLFLFGFAIQAKARELLEKLKIPTDLRRRDAGCGDVGPAQDQQDQRDFLDHRPAGCAAGNRRAKRDDGTPLYRVDAAGARHLPAGHDGDGLRSRPRTCRAGCSTPTTTAWCSMPRQVFFPKTSAWDNLQKSLKGAVRGQRLGASGRNGQRALRAGRQEADRGEGHRRARQRADGGQAAQRRPI